MECIRVIEFLNENGESPFRIWLNSLVVTVRARIQARVLRFQTDQLGDVKGIGSGGCEAKFSFGAGYRIYFRIASPQCMVLLAGGRKQHQRRDICNAKLYWMAWKGANKP